MFKAVWSRPDRPAEAWLTDARISTFHLDFEVDATNPATGLFFHWPRMQEDLGTIFKGELFSGGFSGWTQAADFLSNHAVPIVSTFAIDQDRIAAATYAENYGDNEVERSASEAIHHDRVTFMNHHSTRVFQCDVRTGWWLQLFVVPVDIIVTSPPCPAWSLANVPWGLARDDGFVSIEGLLKATIIHPRILGLENVASFVTHAHHPMG